MESKIVIFLAFTSVTVIANAVVIFFVYQAFSNLTARVTTTAADFRKNSEARQVIETLHVAAEQAAAVTEATKKRMAEFDPVLERAQASYRRRLVAIDSRCDQIADSINTTTDTVRDAVAKPAFSVASFAAGVAKIIEIRSGNSGSDV